MWKRLWDSLVRACALICVGLVVWPAGGPAQAGNTDPIRVVLLGNSITRGRLSGDGGTPYAEVLAAELGATHEVVNIGCGGASSRDWTLSTPSKLCGGLGTVQPNLFEGLAVPALPSDFVTVLLGTNDATGFFEPEPVPALDYGAAIEEIVENLLFHGARTVMLMPPPPQCRADRTERLIAYRDQVIDICTAHPDVVCGPDIFNLLDPSHFAACNVHPNAAGHAVIGIELAEALIEHAPVDADIGVFHWVILPFAPPILPVVIYSEPGFDAAAEVQRSMLSFGATGDEDSLLRPPEGCPEACTEVDADADGLVDLACAFELLETGLRRSSTEAWLMGRLTNGAALDGHQTRKFSARLPRVPVRLIPHLIKLSLCSRKAAHPPGFRQRVWPWSRWPFELETWRTPHPRLRWKPRGRGPLPPRR